MTTQTSTTYPQRPEWVRAKDARSCLALLPVYENAMRAKIVRAIHDPDIEASDVAMLQASMEKNLFALQRRLRMMSQDGQARHASDIERILNELQDDAEILL